MSLIEMRRQPGSSLGSSIIGMTRKCSPFWSLAACSSHSFMAASSQPKSPLARWSTAVPCCGAGVRSLSSRIATATAASATSASPPMISKMLRRCTGTGAPQ
jgi:hypothetical protein